MSPKCPTFGFVGVLYATMNKSLTLKRGKVISLHRSNAYLVIKYMCSRYSENLNGQMATVTMVRLSEMNTTTV